ncbi:MULTISPECIES: type III secretion system protein PrgN [Vagococcus]|uniref:type III secretion system protein PrgN n=1 Tax=Vagococcus TaxID=2737 RepID=UPI000E4D6E99|nr:MULTISPECIES: type III secretion system protein PrgN [Vagococcus]RHH71144.1 type III secretion system protein PrgN [Vagococcus sp. AM17-17]
MTTNTFVYPHPINTFIIKHLNYTVLEFCEQFQYPQSTIATWVSRERRIESLPVSFIYSLSLATSKSMDWVYSELLSLQIEYDGHKEKYKRTKKRIKTE